MKECTICGKELTNPKFSICNSCFWKQEDGDFLWAYHKVPNNHGSTISPKNKDFILAND